MREAKRKLLVNLTGALIVGLLFGYDMTDAADAPHFGEQFAANFLRAFVPYLFAALLAWKSTPRVFGHVVADFVFVPLVGSFLSLLLFYYSGAVFIPPQLESAPTRALVLFSYFSNFVGFGVLALLAVRGVVYVFGKLYR